MGQSNSDQPHEPLPTGPLTDKQQAHHNFGYAPSGVVTLIVIVLVILLLMGRL